jgi:hypothetical protein
VAKEPGRAVPDQSADQPPPGSCGPTGPDVPEHGHQPERGQEVQTRPLRAAAQAEADPGYHPPRPPDQPRPEPGQPGGRPVGGAGLDPPRGHRGGQPGAGPVPVDQQRTEGGQRPEHHEEVQQPGPAVHEVVPLEGQQQPGHATQQGGPEQPAADPGDHQDGQGAAQGHREPPTEGVVLAEDRLAGRDHPLAHRRVDDEVGGGVPDVRGATGKALVHRGAEARRDAALVPVVQERGPLLDVVRLVEDQLVRTAQLPEPEEPAQRGDHQWPQPSPQGGRRLPAQQMRPQPGGEGRTRPASGRAHRHVRCAGCRAGGHRGGHRHIVGAGPPPSCAPLDEHGLGGVS